MSATGIIANTFNVTSILTPVNGALIFNAHTQRALSISLQQKASWAAGIRAIIRRAIDTGETDELGHIDHLATGLVDELMNLSHITGQLTSAA